MDWLVDGWKQRTEQKLAFAGCMAAVLSLRNDPLRGASRLRDFANKLVGYGCAALIFSGVQETCRAVRGRHDFLNSALSGAVTGALVVGYYQGPRYRLLGVLTWGSLGAALHIANSVLRPRYHLEEYLIREGLLSPEATRYREALPRPRTSGSAEVGLLFPEYEHRDILLAAKAVKERELRQINERGAGAAGVVTSSSSSTTATAGAATVHDLEEIPDDDPSYQTWLRSSGFQADALLEQTAQPSQRLRAASPETMHEVGGDRGTTAAGRSSNNRAALPQSDVGEPQGSPEASTVETPSTESHSWAIWIKPWKWRQRKGSIPPSEGGTSKTSEE